VAELRARRRLARRRQRVARIDLGLGVLGAIVLLLATPGLAITALIALLVLALCALSVIVERRRRRRAGLARHPARAARPDGLRPPDAPPGSRREGARDGRRPPR
jgi:hypothetical protein